MKHKKTSFEKSHAEAILLYLDGWILTPGKKHESTDPEEQTIQKIKANKKVSLEEVAFFYNEALTDSLSFMGRENLPTNRTVYSAVNKMAAGLLWKKYVKKSSEQLDETNPYGYGDNLIYRSFKKLEPFIFSTFSVW